MYSVQYYLMLFYSQLYNFITNKLMFFFFFFTCFNNIYLHSTISVLSSKDNWQRGNIKLKTWSIEDEQVNMCYIKWQTISFQNFDTNYNNAYVCSFMCIIYKCVMDKLGKLWTEHDCQAYVDLEYNNNSIKLIHFNYIHRSISCLITNSCIKKKKNPRHKTT